MECPYGVQSSHSMKGLAKIGNQTHRSRRGNRGLLGDSLHYLTQTFPLELLLNGGVRPDRISLCRYSFKQNSWTSRLFVGRIRIETFRKDNFYLKICARSL